MEWSQELVEALGAPFQPGEVEFLPRRISDGHALAIAHIDARTVMRRLDSAVGPGGWEFDFDVLTQDCKKIKGRLTVLGVSRHDAGEAANEDEPLKSAVSDALKRCGVHFGIGRYLYHLPPLWVRYDTARRRFAEPPTHPAEVVKRALSMSAAREAVPVSGSPDTEMLLREPRPVLAEEPQTLDSEKESSARCSNDGCGRALTKGQHDVSIRAFGQPFCPPCQRQQLKVP